VTSTSKSTAPVPAPTRDPLPATFLRRALAYARATGVRFEPTLRHAGWDQLGLPDLRGFTPHRRAVRLFAGAAAEFPRAADTPMDDLATAELWLLHDLLHVVWYDFATLAFGRKAWSKRDFFLEQHLASEAFAVLLLDYHVLSATKHHGLAVDVSEAEWSGLREEVPALPEVRSFALGRELVELYLTGTSRLFKDDLGGKDAPPADVATRIARWRDHEVSYSDKQRWYVFQWWDDLQATQPIDRRAVVANSLVSELLWLAVRLFTVDPEPVFEQHVARAKKQLDGGESYFAKQPKYAAPPVEPDFRFTDVAALPIEEVVAAVRAAELPAARHLFLFWQLLTLEPPDSLKPTERATVTRLAKSAQTPKVDPRAWNDVRELCERRLTRAHWKANPGLRSAFFLP